MIAHQSASNTQFYTFANYRCAYSVLEPINDTAVGTPLLLVHPIGVGLSGKFWQRFCREWFNAGHRNPIYNPDLLGCGDSEMPRVAYTPKDWAEQLQHMIQTVVKKPVILVVQGALFPVAVDLVGNQPDLIRGLVLSGPPALVIIRQNTPEWQHKLAWNLFDSPLGYSFYRYARTEKFLRNFSKKQLFASENKIDAEWLAMLHQGAANMASRYAVFSFLSSFWRQDYSNAIAHIQQPTFVVFGEVASTISREGKNLSPEDQLTEYLALLPQATGVKIKGRNVLPYESTGDFVAAIAPKIREIN